MDREDPEQAAGNALVTGVSRGLGLEIAGSLLSGGWTVYGVSRSETEALTALKERFPGTLHSRFLDLADLGAIRRDLFGSGFISLDVALAAVVNNAAIAYDDLITNLREDSLENMIRANLSAPILICREAIRNMLYHGTAGAFVHVSSVCAHSGYKGLSAYGATKAALEAFSRGLAREWGGRGIRSNCVAPGFMETDMSMALEEEQRATIYRRTSLGLATDVHSVAATVRFLLSKDASSVTGETVCVDAGAG